MLSSDNEKNLPTLDFTRKPARAARTRHVCSVPTSRDHIEFLCSYVLSTRATRESRAQAIPISDAGARYGARRARHQRSRGRRSAPRVGLVDPRTSAEDLFFSSAETSAGHSVRRRVCPRIESLSRGQQRNDRCGLYYARRRVTRRAQTPDTTARRRAARHDSTPARAARVRREIRWGALMRESRAGISVVRIARARAPRARRNKETHAAAHKRVARLNSRLARTNFSAANPFWRETLARARQRSRLLA